MREFAIAASNKFKVDHAYANGVRINDYYLASKNSKQYNKLALMTAQDSFHILPKRSANILTKKSILLKACLAKIPVGWNILA